jgi:hypothetical protein
MPSIDGCYIAAIRTGYVELAAVHTNLYKMNSTCTCTFVMVVRVVTASLIAVTALVILTVAVMIVLIVLATYRSVVVAAVLLIAPGALVRL